MRNTPHDFWRSLFDAFAPMAHPNASVYLDHAATTPASPAAVRAYAETWATHFGNPSSTHGFGTGPKRVLADARDFLSGTLAASQLIFTSGGSEADLLALVGAVARKSPGRVLAAINDHPAVLQLTEILSVHRHKLELVDVTPDGDMDPEALFDRLGRDVHAVSILHGHNELGTLAQLEELVSTIRRAAPVAHIHVDLVQTYGKLPFDIAEVGVDSVAVSAHKLHGPRGVGFLALGADAALVPMQRGGGQEGGMRGGTEDIAGVAAFATAAEEAFTNHRSRADHTRRLCMTMQDELAEGFPDLCVLGHESRVLPHILPLRIPGVNGKALAARCAKRGIAFSTGAACHSKDGPGGKQKGKPKAPPGMAAIGLSAQQAQEVVRFSFGHDTTEADVLHAAEVVLEEAGARVGKS